MKRNRVMALMLAAVLAVGTVGCGGSGNVSAPEAESTDNVNSEEGTSAAENSDFTEEYTWSLATTYATGSPMVDAYYKFADLLKEYSEGTITLNVFPDSALMGENDSFLAIKSGELEFEGGGPAPFYLFTEEYGFMLAPFLIPDMDSYQRLYNSDLVQQAIETWKTDYNLRDVAGMGYMGFRNMSTNKPINTVDDLKGVKLRMNSNQQWSDTWESLGATPIPIALGELYTSIQNGAVDASEGPWTQIKSINLEEVQDYIIETRHVCEVAGIFMAEDLYESLPDNYKAVVDKAGQEAVSYLNDESLKREDEYKQQLIDGGCELIIPETEGFYEKANDILEQYFDTTWTVTTLDEVKEIMAGK